MHPSESSSESESSESSAESSMKTPLRRSPRKQEITEKTPNPNEEEEPMSFNSPLKKILFANKKRRRIVYPKLMRDGAADELPRAVKRLIKARNKYERARDNVRTLEKILGLELLWRDRYLSEDEDDSSFKTSE